jgi:bifunctional non-homologous end joining protein LigD
MLSLFLYDMGGAKAPPSGPGWVHEIKHDGFRIMARPDGAGVRIIPWR